MKKLARLIREGNKRLLTKLVGFLFRRRSYSLFGVPRGLVSLETFACDLYPETWMQNHPPSTIHPSLDWRFHENLEERTVPAAGILLTPNATATKEGCNLTQEGRLITTYLQPIDGKPPHRQDIFRFSTKNFLPRILKIDEPVVTIATGWQGAFYHWMYEVLPRLHLAEKGGHTTAKIFVKSKTSFQKESLELFGFRATQIMNANEFEAVQTPHLVIPSIPRDPTGWACQFLREKILPKIAPSSKQRLYISRNDAKCRRIVNEDQVWGLLQKEGFKRVEMSHLSFKQQVEHFHSAEIIVGPHGAAFSHLVFCMPSTSVLEIFSPAYVNICYWDVCNWVGLSYHYLFGKGKRYPDFYDPHLDPDIEVDLKELKASLKRITG